MLAELLAGASERILYAEHLEGDGLEIHARFCAMGLEGIVSKQQDAPYRSGRVESWIKVKCGKRDAFPIVAFVEKLGAKPRRIASFYVGRREGDRLLYAGKVRGGFTEAEARDLRERLDPIIRKKSPLSEPVKKPKATWVTPVIEAEVAYSTLTENGLLREAVFKGLRDDRELPPAPSRSRRLPADGRRPASERRTTREHPAIPAGCRVAIERGTRRVLEEGLETGARASRAQAAQARSSRQGTIVYHMGPLPPVPEAVHRLTIEEREGRRRHAALGR